MRITLRGNVIARNISASGDVPGAFASNRSYDLAAVSLMRVGCPKEINAARENVASALPIVIEKNRRKYGYVRATDYWPDAVVVAGGNRRAMLMSRGTLTAAAWVERGAIQINADDEISCQELTEKLQQALLRKFYGPQAEPIIGQPWPCILYIYPFENYMIFDFGGQKYRQLFRLDPVARTIALDGESVKVDEKFVNAGGQSGMPHVQTGERSVSNPIPLAMNQVSHRGSPDSELFHCVIRDMSDVDKTVNTLLSAIKFGLYRPMQPSFYPVPLSPDGKILAPFIRAGIAPVDIVGWAAALERQPSLTDLVRKKRLFGSVRRQAVSA